MGKTSLSFSQTNEFEAEKAHAPVDPFVRKSPGCPWVCQEVAVFGRLGDTAQGVQMLMSSKDTWFFNWNVSM